MAVSNRMSEYEKDNSDTLLRELEQLETKYVEQSLTRVERTQYYGLVYVLCNRFPLIGQAYDEWIDSLPGEGTPGSVVLDAAKVQAEDNL